MEFYDRVICYGELMSSAIIHHFLQSAGIGNQLVRCPPGNPENRFEFQGSGRELARASQASRRAYQSIAGTENRAPVVTQGFIGSDMQGRCTSLGREGSDYTASIFASLLDAE